MKRLFASILLVSVMFLIMPQINIAQNDSINVEQTDTTTVTQGDEETTISFEAGSVFGSIGGMATLVLLITAYIKKKLKTNDNITIVISGIVSLLLSAVGYFLVVGIFVGLQPSWWYIPIYGFSAMLIANGISTWSYISGFLKLINLKVPTT